MPELKPDASFLIGIDIGGTKLAVVITDRSGTILHKERRPTVASRGPKDIVAELCDMTRTVMNHESATQESVAGIGVSCGGPLDTSTGIVYSPPNLPGWDAVPLKSLIEEELSLSCHVENDANAGALAEWYFGAGRGFTNVVYMTMSTGIGGGLILDEKLYRGTGDTAGEVGHMTIVPNGPPCGCGKSGCLEALCSGPSIARRAREALADAGQRGPSLMLHGANNDLAAVTSEIVMDAARDGDELALKIVDETARYMAIGLGNIINILNPQIVIVGTILVKASDLLLEPIREYIRAETWDRVYDMVRIVPAELGDSVGDLAAIAVMKQAFEETGAESL
jgi:glucokinase